MLGLIPGVGAMYNGQFFKGLIHVVIFAVLVSITDHYGIFGIFIGAWILYQSFEAYHTAMARRDGHAVARSAGIERGGQLAEPGRPAAVSGPAAGSGPAQAGPAAPGASGPYAGPIRPVPSPYQAPYHAAGFTGSGIRRSADSARSSGAAAVLAAQGTDRRRDPDRLRIDFSAEPDGLSSPTALSTFSGR